VEEIESVGVCVDVREEDGLMVHDTVGVGEGEDVSVDVDVGE
jgi:hypothetical protein